MLVPAAQQHSRKLVLAHAHFLTDRDLKPENVLLLSDCQLRITDFGLSRQVQRLPTEEQKAKQMNSVHLTECEQAPVHVRVIGCATVS